MPASVREKVIAGIAGAVLATCATVALYECGGRAGPGSASVAAAPPASGAPSSSTAPPPADATREQLLARDAEQRRMLKAASAEIARLSQQEAPPPPPRPPGTLSEFGWGKEHPDDDPLAPSADTLARWAKTCTVNYDYPPMHESEPPKIDELIATRAGLSAAEVTAANQVLAKQYIDWNARVRELYVEVVGPTPGVEDLSLLAMTVELQQKGDGGPDSENLNRRIARERAGQVAPPSPGELASASPYERYYRELVELGNQTESLLAERIGAKLAHALRAKAGGWGARASAQGCMEEPEEAAAGATR
jgi:hypothetical protein